MDETIKRLEDMIEVIARMIPKEKQSQNIYRETAAWAPNEMTRLLFLRLAEEEEKHEGKLEAALQLLQKELEEAKERRRSGE